MINHLFAALRWQKALTLSLESDFSDTACNSAYVSDA